MFLSLIASSILTRFYFVARHNYRFCTQLFLRRSTQLRVWELDALEDDEEKDGPEQLSGATESEREGERKGRKAFMSVRYLMEGVRIHDEVLNGWIAEMVDAGLTGA